MNVHTPAAHVLHCFALVLLLGLVLSPVWAEDPNPQTIHSNRGAWPLYRQWTPHETRHFAKWVEHIYEVKSEGTIRQRLAKLEGVLTDPEINLLLDPEFAGDPSNPQIDVPTIRALHSVIDCGKLTLILTTYYAYRRGLPWMVGRVRSGDGQDIRVADFTIPCGGISSFEYCSASRFMIDAVTGFCTGNYRVEPGRENSESSDTVPVAVDRSYLMPGCLYYLDGHVLMLGQIDPYGDVYFLDSTTAATRDIYTYNGLNAITGLTPATTAEAPYAGCYRGFRIYRYPIADVDDEGNVVQVRRRTDEEMKAFGYSTEQYDRMRELTARQYIDEGGLRLTSFHDFIRMRLQTADKMQPTAVIEAAADKLVRQLEYREQLVQAAWADVQARGPITFPEASRSINVFNAPGRWGEFATAELDTRLRTAYFQFLTWIERGINWFDMMPEFVGMEGLNENLIWTPADLAHAVMDEKNRVFSQHSIVYRNAAGEPVPLSLLDIEERLYDLSFDPNHPPELRWGAKPGSTEARSAPESPTVLPNGEAVPMADAYVREAYYRSVLHRDTDESYLSAMFLAGFPVRGKFDDAMAVWLYKADSPPLVPHGGRAAWQRKAARLALTGKQAARVSP
jgi:hypothetical protein